MREGGQILGQVLAELKNITKPGITSLELDQFAEKKIIELGGLPAFKGYSGYTHTLCVNINDQVVHSIPSKQLIHEGDLVSLDCGVLFGGLNTDAAVSVIAGKSNNLTIIKMLSTAEKSLQKGIEAAKLNSRTNQIGKAIEKIIQSAGFFVVNELSGHGIGKSVHEDPYILNFEEEELGPPLLEGMTIAIEPIFTNGDPRLKTLPDHWTTVTKSGGWAIQIEHTIAITKNGPEIITLATK